MSDITKIFDTITAALEMILSPLNDSFVALIPKKPSYFRPINLINSIQKIFSKNNNVQITTTTHV
jgi:hypothetical protein